MKINSSIISAFLAEQDITQEESFWLLQMYQEPDKKRKDIVQELCSQLTTIVEAFPVFNEPLWDIVFSDKKAFLDTIVICPVVGDRGTGNHIEKKDGIIYIVMDLLYIADFTRIVSQMVYIIQNYLTFEIAKLCILHDFPFPSKKYLDVLNYLTFTNGFANYLAWNQSCAQYVFYTEKYEPHKEKAFGMLASAIEVQNKVSQQNIIKHAMTADFWSSFPSVAGMFYFDDIYRERGIQGVHALYKNGPQKFICTIFTS